MVNLVQLGLGPLGQKVVRFAMEREGLTYVAAVDPAPDKVGKDLGELCGVGKLGVTVSRDLATALRGKQADVAIITTVSSVEKLVAQVEETAKAKLDIVSTCEELSYCRDTFQEAASRINSVCETHGVSCIGTGVNPGFLMDYLPCVLTSVCQKVERIAVTRFQDASHRRIPFQQKIGTGLTLDQFRKKVADGTLRHVGLAESIRMIAACVGWKLDQFTESLEPIVATERVATGHRLIEAGMARGVEQIGRGWVNGREVITLHFRAAVGEPESADSIEIQGEPSFRSTIPGGVNGDIATCAIIVNAVRAIQKAAPGLKTMLDIPVPGYYRSL